MPVYNGEQHLAESIESILAQTFTDFDFVIIDDASTDNSPAILAKYATRDSRIRIITNEKNLNIAASLNKGLAIIRSPYIARMDADDWAYPNRLARQYEFMQANPQVTVCGGWVEIYETGKIACSPHTDTEIRTHMFFNNSIAHPTVMFRKDVVIRWVGGYNESMPPVEDYDLWVRLMASPEVRFAALAEALLRYRTHPGKDRTAYWEKQIYHVGQVRLRHLEYLGFSPGYKRYSDIIAGTARANTGMELRACGAWIAAIIKANSERKIYDPAIFITLLDQHWLRACLIAYPRIPIALLFFWYYTPHAKDKDFLFSVFYAFILRNKECTQNIIRRIKKWVHS
jgi:glycosyltransferase involved in cell wall biosynthesis